MLCALWFLPGALRAEHMPDGEILMRQLRAALPVTPLRLAGELQSRDRRGDMVRTAPVEMIWHWGGPEPWAEYVLRDRFGSEVDRVRVSWPIEKTEKWDRLFQPLPGLDLTWADLTLSFLWWEGATVIGSERVRGRYSYVLDVPAPEETGGIYAGMRLWIDPDTSLLMQADAYDHRDRIVRRLQVKSIRKIDDLWMVQNLEILNPATRERVTLRVRQVQALDESFDAVLD